MVMGIKTEHLPCSARHFAFLPKNEASFISYESRGRAISWVEKAEGLWNIEGKVNPLIKTADAREKSGTRGCKGLKVV
jgi:hypothetical protein